MSADWPPVAIDPALSLTPQSAEAKARPRVPIRVGGVLLAAGESRRMGGPNKLAMRLDGVALVRRTAQTLLAAGISPLVVVLGHAAGQVAPLLDGLAVKCEVNPDYREGQQTSVLAGLAALDEPLDGIVIALSDLPLLRAEHLRDLVAAFGVRSGGSVMVPMADGQRGNPIIFDAGLRAAILGTSGGARAWIDAHPQAVVRFNVAHRGFTTDLDTLADVAALAAQPDAPNIALP